MKIAFTKPVPKAIWKSESKFRVVSRFIQPDDLQTLSLELLVELAWAKRDSKNAVVFFFFLSVGPSL